MESFIIKIEIFRNLISPLVLEETETSDVLAMGGRIDAISQDSCDRHAIQYWCVLQMDYVFSSKCKEYKHKHLVQKDDRAEAQRSAIIPTR